MKLSVIIVSYNVEHFLAQCLVSVERAIENFSGQTSSSSVQIEVFVVDNISVDGTCKMVKERFPWVKLIENLENLGFSKANNQAIKQSEAEYILLLNPDTVVQEDTFSQCISFADDHPQLGGMGVPMFDGSGTYLPESKRGIPTPWASLCRISGLFRLAPKSKNLNNYYAGHLSADDNHEIEVLSGAFMWMRKAAIDEVGMLDEDFFMYGEDIDLSWRIIKGGWENHYFTGTRIIHYKGESTKKGSLNYVSIFYRAMLIFAAKHFEGTQAQSFNLLIRLAIYARASLSVVRRIVSRLAWPVFEGVSLHVGLFVLLSIYANYAVIQYDQASTNFALGIYSVVWVFFLWLFGRVTMGGWRLGAKPKSRLIVAGKVESSSIKQLLESIEIRDGISDATTSITPNELSTLQDVVRVHSIGEVVFSGRDVRSEDIITALASLVNSTIVCRIAWTDDGYVMGSGGPGPDPVTELDRTIYGPSARRSKRIFDLLSSFILFVFSPILLVTGRAVWITHSVNVFFGKSTWIGLDGIHNQSRPSIIKAVENEDDRVRERLKLAYARKYNWFEDLKLVLNALLLQSVN